MINKQLLDIINEKLLKGIDRESISKELLSNGWTQSDIDEGFFVVKNSKVQTPTTKDLPIKISAKSNRVNFYFSTLIILGVIYYALSALIAKSGLIILFPSVLIIVIFILVTTIVIYEIKHPINHIHDESKLKSIYKVLTIISYVLLLSTLIAIYSYFAPIIKNFNILRALDSIDYQSPWQQWGIGEKPSLKNFLMDKGAILIYTALILNLFTISLLKKRKEIAKPLFIILIILSSPFLFVTLFRGPTKLYEFTNMRINKAKDILINEKLQQVKDNNLCQNYTDYIELRQCILDLYKKN